MKVRFIGMNRADIIGVRTVELEKMEIMPPTGHKTICTL